MTWRCSNVCLSSYRFCVFTWQMPQDTVFNSDRRRRAGSHSCPFAQALMAALNGTTSTSKFFTSSLGKTTPEVSGLRQNGQNPANQDVVHERWSSEESTFIEFHNWIALNWPIETNSSWTNWKTPLWFPNPTSCITPRQLTAITIPA